MTPSSSRHRLNLSLDCTTVRRLSVLSRRFGFRSPSTLGAAMVSRLSELLSHHGEEEEEDRETVARLFREFGDWQKTLGNRHDINQRL